MFKSRLAKECSISERDARKIRNELVLSGFRTKWPWLWMAGLLLAYIPLRFGSLLSDWGKLGEFVMSLLFIGSISGALYISERISYPAMVKKGREIALGNRSDGGEE